MPFKPVADEQYEAGFLRGRKRLGKAAIAQKVSYDPQRDGLVIDLDSCSLYVPRSKIEEFGDLTPEDMKKVRLSAIGDAIAVGSHDVHVDLSGLLADLFPEAALDKALARRGGRSTSPAKAQAARVNGMKGGRPKTRKIVSSPT